MTRHNSILLFILCGILFSFDAAPDKSSWKSIFNGKDLKGWKIKISGFPMGENFGNTFRVDSGILSIRYDQYGENFNNRFGALYYGTRLRNYRLRVEYRFVGDTAPGAPSWGFRDSGIQYLGQDPSSLELTQQFPVCVEFNLHGGNGKEDRPTGELCTPGTSVEIKGKKNDNFCTPPDVQRTFHGDQWVTAEVEIQDGKIKHFVNGEQIMEAENARYDPKHQYGKKFANEKNDIIKEGFISLQSNSHPIDFRKIEIIEY
ncbi:MAG TPA: DUF1080 domain-containing protein [Chryseolinea sp.]|nr:DUF1080 domain-containing protein [Chryseolinea sp.]